MSELRKVALAGCTLAAGGVAGMLLVPHAQNPSAFSPETFSAQAPSVDVGVLLLLFMAQIAVLLYLVQWAISGGLQPTYGGQR